MKKVEQVEKIGSNTTWLSILTLLLTAAALVLAALAINAGNQLYVASASEFFYDLTRAEEAAMLPWLIGCGAGSVVAIVLSMIIDRMDNKLLSMIAGILKIAIPAALMVALLYFLYGSLTGLGWTFFSNAELVIDPKATAAGQQVIISLVLFFVAVVLGIIAAFIPTSKKIKE